MSNSDDLIWKPHALQAPYGGPAAVELDDKTSGDGGTSKAAVWIKVMRLTGIRGASRP